MIVIAGFARLHEDKIDEAREAGAEMARRSREESGCLDYRFSIDIEDETVARVFEHWASKDALEAHFATEHFAAFSEMLLTSLDGPAEFSRFEVTSVGPLFE